MDEAKPSRTSDIPAIMRAVHQTSDDEPKILADPAGRRLFARFETTNAGCAQANLPKPSNRIAQADKTFPVRLWDFALHVALADLAQGIKFFGA